MKKDAFWFSHDSNASNDEKILELRSEFGWEGYGIFWAIVEKLRDSKNYCYSSNATAGLALSLAIDKDKLKQFLDLCFSLKLFIEKDGFFYSDSLLSRMVEMEEKRRRRANAGRLGGIAKAINQQSYSNATAIPSKESKVNKSKEKESKVNKESDIVPGQAPAPKGANKKALLNEKEEKFLAMFNEITGRDFKSLNPKAKRQFTRLLDYTPAFTIGDFKEAITKGHQDSKNWKDQTKFTPEYITREDKFDLYLNASKHKASVAPAAIGMGNIAEKIRLQALKD